MKNYILLILLTIVRALLSAALLKEKGILIAIEKVPTTIEKLINKYTYKDALNIASLESAVSQNDYQDKEFSDNSMDIEEVSFNLFI